MTCTRINVFLDKMFRITTSKFLTANQNMTLLLKVFLHCTAPLLTVHLPQYKNDILHQSDNLESQSSPNKKSAAC